MSRTLPRHVALAAAAACSAVAAAPAGAGVVRFPPGEQDVADGTAAAPVLNFAARTAAAGQVNPFDNSTFGHDTRPSVGAFEYVHPFDLRGATPVSATLTTGLANADSPARVVATPRQTIGPVLPGIPRPQSGPAEVSAAGSLTPAEVPTLPGPTELPVDAALTATITPNLARAGNPAHASDTDPSRLLIETDPLLQPPPGHADLPPAPDAAGNNSGGNDADPQPVPVPVPVALWSAGVLLAGLFAVPKRLVRHWLRT